MKKIAVFLLFALSILTAGAADRIATVDMEKVFREYYKSKIAEEAIKQQAENYRKYLKKLNDELAALRQKALDAQADAQNYALSEDEKVKMTELAAKAKTAFDEKKAEIEIYVQGRTADMRNLEAKKRGEIVDDIKAEIKRRANAEGYTVVLDISGKTTNDLPTVLFSHSERDISDIVIRELNRQESKPAPAANQK